jgi:hypothetical protein
MQPATVVFTGSRGWTDDALVRSVVDALPSGTIIVHGDARGLDRMVDTAARRVAGRYRVVPFAVTRDDYLRSGRGAPILRNGRMLRMVDRDGADVEGVEKPSLVYAFLYQAEERDSPGTRNCIRQAEGLGLRVVTHKAGPLHEK